MKRIILAVLLGGVAGLASAEDLDSGLHLLKTCRAVIAVIEDKPDADMVDANFCMGFVKATFQAVGTTAYVCESTRYCPPDEATNEQAIRIVIRYMLDHPKELHKDAFFLAFAAFTDAFPCREKEAQ